MTRHLPSTMSAVLVRAPGAYGLEEMPRPSCPRDGVLLKVQACGLCGSDLRTLRSGHPRVKLPWVVGHEVSGAVVEIGPEYCGPYAVGDVLAVAPLAYCGSCDFCRCGVHELCEAYRELAQAWPGGFAEYMALPEPCLSLGTIVPVPEGLDPVLAAISEPVSSCVNAQEKGAIGLGDTVVIIGAGPIGCIHAALARTRGADRVIVADRRPSRLAHCKPFVAPGAIINVAETDLVEEVHRETDGKGADVVICATSAPIAQVQAMEMARKGGRVLLFGGLPEDQSKPSIDTNLIHYRALHVMGTTIFAPRHQKTALGLLASGRISGDKLVSHRLPLCEFAEGVRLASQGDALKVVFVTGATGED